MKTIVMCVLQGLSRAFSLLCFGLGLVCVLFWCGFIVYLVINGIDDDGTTESLVTFLFLFGGPLVLAGIFFWLWHTIQEF